MRLKLPSPSMVVALTALVIALGGTAYAASQIDGSTIKNGTIAGGKLKKDTLTGRQIKEGSLGTVPSAKNATTAKTAATATSALTAGTAANAGHAASATSAGTAATAGNAFTLGGLNAGQFVQGGGQTFANGASEGESTADTPVFTLPGLGTMTMGCSAAGNTDYSLNNATGATVQVTDSGSYFLSGGSGAQTESGGRDAAPNTALTLIDSGLTSGQFQVTADWPAGAPTHGAQLTVGWFRDSAAKCELNAAGFVR
jgi:hypothetical protein